MSEMPDEVVEIDFSRMQRFYQGAADAGDALPERQVFLHVPGIFGRFVTRKPVGMDIEPQDLPVPEASGIFKRLVVGKPCNAIEK